MLADFLLVFRHHKAPSKSCLELIHGHHELAKVLRHVFRSALGWFAMGRGKCDRRVTNYPIVVSGQYVIRSTILRRSFDTCRNWGRGICDREDD